MPYGWPYKTEAKPDGRPKHLPRSKKIGVDVFAGFCAGVAVTVVGHPFETVKVRLQTQPSGAKQIYTGLLDCAKKTYQWEGFRGFYSGVTAPLYGQLFFRSAMFFSFGEATRELSHHGKRPLTVADYALAGSIAWGVGALIECPLQLASSQLQVDVIRMKSVPGYKPRFTGTLDVLTQALRHNGIRGLYQGFSPHLVRNGVGGAFHFGIFEGCREYLAWKHPDRPVTIWHNMVAGAIGGLFMWSVTLPADVVKSVMQSDALLAADRKHRTVLDTVRHLYAEGGLPRFARGFTASVMRAIPVNAVLLTVATMLREQGYLWIAEPIPDYDTASHAVAHAHAHSPSVGAPLVIASTSSVAK